jgi:protoheme IX farnesyltransferase
MIYGDDYKKGGFPVLCDVFDKLQLKRITFMWLAATVLTAMFIPLFGIINYAASDIVLLLISGWMLYNSFVFLRSDADRKQVVNTFVRINFYTMMLTTLLIADKVLSF